MIQKDRNGKTFVYVLEAEENNFRVVKTDVVEANSYANFSYISEGLNSNSTLVEKGARLVKNGEIVKLVD